MVKLTPQSEWTRRIAKAKEPPKLGRKPGPPKGTPLPGRPTGPVIARGKPIAMSMAMISLYMQGTKL